MTSQGGGREWRALCRKKTHLNCEGWFAGCCDGSGEQRPHQNDREGRYLVVTSFMPALIVSYLEILSVVSLPHNNATEKEDMGENEKN